MNSLLFDIPVRFDYGSRKRLILAIVYSKIPRLYIHAGK
jgi:hypothetical protein